MFGLNRSFSAVRNKRSRITTKSRSSDSRLLATELRVSVARLIHPTSLAAVAGETLLDCSEPARFALSFKQSILVMITYCPSYPKRAVQHRLLYWAMPLLASLFLGACASSQKAANHSFSFDTRGAVPAVEVLNYRYGDSDMTGTRPPKWALEEGRIGQQAGVYGRMRPADTLYVKWRIKSTGQVFEDSVDLRHRLPNDMTDKIVYFDIKGPQLFVYVVSPEDYPLGTPRNSLRLYSYRPYVQIYPDQSKQ